MGIIWRIKTTSRKLVEMNVLSYHETKQTLIWSDEQTVFVFNTWKFLSMTYFVCIASRKTKTLLQAFGALVVMRNVYDVFFSATHIVNVVEFHIMLPWSNFSVGITHLSNRTIPMLWKQFAISNCKISLRNFHFRPC